MSKEELEIQAVLSPSSRSTESANVPPIQADLDAAPPSNTSTTTLSAECMKELAAVVTESMIKGFEVLKNSSTFGERRREPSRNVESDSTYGYDSGDDEDEEHSLPIQGPSAAGIALPASREPAEFLGFAPPQRQLAVPVEVHAPATPPPQVAGVPVDPTSPVVEPQPDTSLPRKLFRAPTNWNPSSDVISWARVTLDELEWSEEDRQSLMKEFSPMEKYDPIFTAVPFPSDLRPSFMLPDVKSSDYLFNREGTEAFLFDAQQDLSCGLRPLVELLSSMKGRPDLEPTRLLLARVFQSIASASSKISRGRRELARRFVPTDTARALYLRKPNHLSLFGANSVATAVTDAVAASKVNKDLVYHPKKRKVQQPFRSSRKFSRRRTSYQSSNGYHRQSAKFGSNQKNRSRGTRRSRGRKKQSSAKSNTQE